MDWYIVIKTINGRRYRYRQKTWRERGRVHTRSEYIGLAADGEYAKGRQPRHPDLTGAATLTLPVAPIADSAVEESLRALMGEQSENWEHGWSASRRGPSLVQRDKGIEKMLRHLGVKWTHSTAGAFYNPTRDLVNIPPARCFLDKDRQSATQAYYVVVFHELGNAARHAKYFQVWLSRTDDREEALAHAKREAERAVRYILERGTMCT